MKQCFAYIRVSTVRQGEHGVSLQEQRYAIEQYAQRAGLSIMRWFEERESAAQRGRPAFTAMLQLLRSGKAHGVIFHKIDRSSRNHRDWAEISDLVDAGVDVHFTGESLDLTTTGGRLSADIQATIAAHYIRALRQEVMKGLYGRLRQGIWPFGAPPGYLDHGGGKPKTICPTRGPLVKQAFELYASGAYSLRSLVSELYRRGLRTRRGGRVSMNGLSTILNNPFYVGRMRVRRNSQTFEGVHEALIPESLFREVQERLRGKTRVKVQRHEFALRQLFRCDLCGRVLTGERQKGHAYYRCHTRDCPMKCVREERLSEEIVQVLASLRCTEPRAVEILRQEIRDGLMDLKRKAEGDNRALGLQLDQVAAQIARLTDAYIDGGIDREVFENRKAELLSRQAELRERLGKPRTSDAVLESMAAETFELAQTASLGYGLADSRVRRRLAEEMTSNRVVSPYGPVVRPSEPYQTLQKLSSVLSSEDERGAVRTEARKARGLLNKIIEWLFSHAEERAAILQELAGDVRFLTSSFQDSGEGEDRKAA